MVAINTDIIFASLLYYLYLFIGQRIRDLILVNALVTLPAIALGGAYWYNMIVTWLIANLLYFVAIKRMKIEQKNRVKINIYRTLRRGVPIIGSALSLLIAAGFYFSVINKQKIGELPKFEIQLSQSITNNGLRIINFIVPTEELKWILQGTTVDEYIMRTMRSEGDIGLTQLTKISQNQEQESVALMENVRMPELNSSQKKELVVLNRRALEKQLGVELSGNERIDELINNMVNKRINEIFNGEMFSASVVPLGAAFGIFVTVRSLTWVFNIVLYWLTTGVFKLLVLSKLIKIRKETREIELIQ